METKATSAAAAAAAAVPDRATSSGVAQGLAQRELEQKQLLGMEDIDTKKKKEAEKEEQQQKQQQQQQQQEQEAMEISSTESVHGSEQEQGQQHGQASESGMYRAECVHRRILSHEIL